MPGGREGERRDEGGKSTKREEEREENMVRACIWRERGREGRRGRVGKEGGGGGETWSEGSEACGRERLGEGGVCHYKITLDSSRQNTARGLAIRECEVKGGSVLCSLMVFFFPSRLNFLPLPFQ